MQLNWAFVTLGLALGASEICSNAAPSRSSDRQFYRAGDLSLVPGDAAEQIGPLYSVSRHGPETSRTFSPVFSLRTDRAADSTEFEFAYPLITYHRFGEQRRFQILQLFSVAGSRTLNEQENRRFTLFPVYFQQRSSDPTLSYTALFPFYGILKNRLFRDEIRFILFPIYSQTKKRDMVTKNFLYPFYHHRTGPGLEGVQVWPLFGTEHLSPSEKINSLGETEVVGGRESFFLLWPFFFVNKNGVGTDNPEIQNIFLPFYSLQRSPNRDSSSYFWPLGPTIINDREKDYREWGFPWPFITFARGEGKTSNRVWPLFSKSKNDSLESGFLLWPVYKYNRAASESFERQRRRVFLFLYSDLIEKNTAANTAFERTDLWPLFSARRNHDGSERFQLLAPVEPFLPTSLDVERIYSPIWTLWLSETDRNNGTSTRVFLWNLFRSEATTTAKKYSLLFGLFQYQYGPEGRRWRIFYIPIGKTPNE